ncbi:MAG TPA: nuclear transport factor 2 family protein [Candidatus Acidoferrum sp.]|nr:nuclear transport factor 2 family protein [Candidatus Acidoferrum sp.]
MPFSPATRHSIRRILLIMLALAFSTGWAGAQSAADPHAKDRATVTQLITNQQLSWNKGNIDAFVEAYWHSPDLTFSGTSGVQRGYDAVLQRYKKSYPDRATMGQLAFSDLDFHFIGNDGALVLGHWHLTRDKDKGDIGGVFSLVWQRFPEGWRIIHDHTSAVPPAK